MNAAAMERLRAAIDASERKAASDDVDIDEIRTRTLALFSARQRDHGAQQLVALNTHLRRIAARLEAALAAKDADPEVADRAYRDAMQAIHDAARDAALANQSIFDAVSETLEQEAASAVKP